MQRWFYDLYSDQTDPLATQPFYWPFSPDELCDGLQHLPLVKALSPEFAPAPFWKTASRPIAEYLDEFLHTCSQTSSLPQCWSSGTLCFLPKNTKRTQQPGDLRPIALLEPCGKAVMGIFAARLAAEVDPELRRWPQFCVSTSQKLRRGAASPFLTLHNGTQYHAGSATTSATTRAGKTTKGPGWWPHLEPGSFQGF